MSLRRRGVPEVVERIRHKGVRPSVAGSELHAEMRREEVEAEIGLRTRAGRADHPRAWGRGRWKRGRLDGRGRSVNDASGEGVRPGGGGRWLWHRRRRGLGGGGAGGDGVLQDGEPLANAAEVRGLVLDEAEEAGPARWRRR